MSGNQAALLGGGALGLPPATIINAFSTGGWAGFPVTAGAMRFAKASLSGAMTANTLKTALSVSGSGVLFFAGVSTVDTTSRTMRMVLTLDGQATPCFDSTSASIVTANMLGTCVGYADTNNAYTPIFQEIPFNTSCLFQIASSLTETDKMNIYLLYRTN